MARIFISFIGTGRPGQEPIGYDEVEYTFPHGQAIRTAFVQRAIVQWCGSDTFDSVVILATPESQQKHELPLREELVSVGCPDEIIRVDGRFSTAQDEESQWMWFDRLLEHVPDDSEVVLDFTHGFRSVQLVQALAMGFVQKVRRARLKHAFYGFIESGGGPGRVIDLAPFYLVNDWAEAVGRLIDGADAGGIIALAEAETGATSFKSLAEPPLIDAIKLLNQVIKDIRVDEVGEAARNALAQITARLHDGKAADQRLLKLILNKFAVLGERAETDHYDGDYFDIQLGLARILLEHELHMQAFTVLRELIASLGMVGVRGKYRKPSRRSSKGRGYRRRFGEVFVSMLQFDEPKWDWGEPGSTRRRDAEHLMPFWDALKGRGLTEELQKVVRPTAEIRNAFDHAWVAKSPKEAAALRPHESGQEALEVLAKALPAVLEVAATLNEAPGAGR